jgi:hypothetical protein
MKLLYTRRQTHAQRRTRTHIRIPNQGGKNTAKTECTRALTVNALKAPQRRRHAPAIWVAAYTILAQAS